MKTLLSNIAHLQTGVHARPDVTGNVRYLQISHFAGGKLLNQDHGSYLNSEDIHWKHVLMAGDILFVAKGNNNFAAFPIEDEEYTAASSSFIVIRVNNANEVLPEYLALFINLPATQATLKGLSKGTSIPSISIQALANLPVQVPPLEIQKRVLQFSQLATLETTILQRIAKLKNLYQNQVIEKIIAA